MRYIEYKTYQFFNKVYFQRMDYFYDSEVIRLYLNRINYAGGKILNHKLLYRVLLFFKNEGYVPIDFFYQLIHYNKINLKTVHISVAGRPYQIPVPIPTSEGFSITIRYALKGSRLQPANTFEQRLLMEFEGNVYSLCHSYGYDASEKMLTQGLEDRIYKHYRWR